MAPESQAAPQRLPQESSDLTALGRHRLIAIQPQGSMPPLFWIPGGYGSVRMTRLRDFAVRMGPDQPMYGLGSSPAQSLAEIDSATERASAYVALIRELQPQGPYHLAGFCLGGILAYEAAQQLSSQGQKVAFLALLNAWMPISCITAAQWSQLLLYRLKHHVSLAYKVGWHRGVPYLFSKLRTIPKLWQRGWEMRKIPYINESATTSHGPASPKRVLWATVRIWGKYVPRPFAGKVYLFVSEEPDLAGVGQRVDPRCAWARLCSSCEIVHLRGEHAQMLEPPLLNSFADIFARYLAESQSAPASGGAVA